MSNSFGKNYRLTVFGQSHSNKIGIIIDGLKAGIKIDEDLIYRELDRRRPGKNSYSTKRKEEDAYEIASGLVDGRTCGSPLSFIIKNGDYKSKDYEGLNIRPRPSHADYPAFVKYNGYNDIAGGGQFSGRMTAPIVIAGAIAKQILGEKGIKVCSHIGSVANIEDKKIPYTGENIDELLGVSDKDFPVLDDKVGLDMISLIEKYRDCGDSLGGIVECFAFGLPVGLGEPLYNSFESVLSRNIFSVPAVRGIEFGLGFEASKLTGSQHNDEYYYDQEGRVRTHTNNHGGVIGGMTTAMPLVFKVAIKPTSSISLVQKTVDLTSKEDVELKIEGRHDPCIVPRVLPVIEAMTAITILDLMMEGDFFG